MVEKVSGELPKVHEIQVRSRSAGASLAIMQPYFLPYLGYWQLIGAVDTFLIYDDVNFIKSGWINRNRILINGEPRYITIPIRGASPNVEISSLLISEDTDWASKILKSIQRSYSKAAYFDEMFPTIEKIMKFKTQSLSEFVGNSIVEMCRFLGVATKIVPTSRIYGNEILRSEARILDICRREGAGIYVNPEGGRSLYSAENFECQRLKLKFLQAGLTPYPQRKSDGFVSHLSIVDVLANTGRLATRRALADFRLDD